MYRWKRLNKAILKMPKVAEDEIIISTDGKGNRRVFFGAINVKKYFGENILWVELYYDEDIKAIGFKPVAKRTKDAYRLHSFGIPVSGIENEFGFQDGRYKRFWNPKEEMWVAEKSK